MKKVTMFVLKNCPHCHRALRLIDQLKAEHPEYSEVKFDVIEENDEPEKTKGYDYWYVPTFFVGDKKMMEGVPSLDKVEETMLAALSA